MGLFYFSCAEVAYTISWMVYVSLSLGCFVFEWSGTLYPKTLKVWHGFDPADRC